MSDRLANMRTEQRQHWHTGRPVPVEEYLGRYPDLQVDPEAVIDLIYNEILLREERGDAIQDEEYFQRFPQYVDKLRRQLAVDRLLREPWLAESSEWSALDTVEHSPGAARAENPGGPDGAAPAAAAPAVDTVPLMPVTAEHWPVVPGYQILRRCGRGTYGVVYEARQLSLNRRVALKVLRRADDLLQPSALALFRREAETIARIRHSGIIEIYDSQMDEDCPYFAMELAEGGNLHQKLGRRPLAPLAAAALVEQLALTMHAVHQLGIVHRDLKPGNVLLTGAGALKIADFGLAKYLEGSASIAPSGTLIGTASYMAPEQAEGRSKEVGPATDVYSLGAILYETLTGQPPFHGGGMMEILAQVRLQPPIPPSRLQSGIPPDLEAICLKCLSKAPADRFASAAELADRLSRVLKNLPIPERPRRWWEKLRRLGERWLHSARIHPRRTGSLAALVLLVVLGAFLVPTLTPVDARTQAERTLAAGETYYFQGTEPLPGPLRPLFPGTAPPKPNPDGSCFTVEALDTAFFEVVADPQVAHYKFSVKVRQDETSGLGSQVGLFFGHADLTGLGLPYDHLFTLTFADCGKVAAKYPNDGGRGRGRVQLIGRYVHRTDQGVKELDGLGLGPQWPFHPSGVKGQPTSWRALAVEVSPTTIRTFWGDDGATLKVIGELGVANYEANLGHLQFMHKLPPLSTQLRPRLSLGLFVSQSRASFRDLRIEPLPNTP